MDELGAMQAIDEALQGVPEDARGRVLRWACDKFGVVGVSERGRPDNGGGDSEDSAEVVSPNDMAELMDACQPRTGLDRVLIGSYWYQVVKGEASLTGQQVNTSLKHLGHGVANITDAFGSLINRKPALVMQVQKSGKSRQARKKYKLTNEGIKRVKEMLGSEGR